MKKNIKKEINRYLINECHKNHINIPIIKYLVEHGVAVNIRDANDLHTPLSDAYSKGNEAVVKYLVKHGADGKYRE